MVGWRGGGGGAVVRWWGAGVVGCACVCGEGDGGMIGW